jgi:hypothetical protein
MQPLKAPRQSLTPTTTIMGRQEGQERQYIIWPSGFFDKRQLS